MSDIKIKLHKPKLEKIELPSELDLIIEREKQLKEAFEKEESTKTVEDVFKTAL